MTADARTAKEFTKIRRVQFPQFFFKLEPVSEIKARESHVGRVLANGMITEIQKDSKKEPLRRVMGGTVGKAESLGAVANLQKVMRCT